ncbi:hypothetical protein AgCh_035499 [Apium graveolens]
MQCNPPTLHSLLTFHYDYLLSLLFFFLLISNPCYIIIAETLKVVFFLYFVMSVSDIELVLEFLRKNGLSGCESALMEDIMEKSQLGGVDFQRFLFPVLPPPPELKILTIRSHEKALDDVDSVSNSSNDEFVSVDSSTTDLYPSDFTNPYGVHVVGVASSQASSDRLSQFGTARDYHDFDMQNDLNWYKDKEDNCDFMPPCLGSSEFYEEPSEDKFVMTFQKQDQCVNDSDFKHESDTCQSMQEYNQADKLWSFPPMDYVKDGVEIKDYYDLKESSYDRDEIKNDKNSYLDQDYYNGDSKIQILTNFKESNFHCKSTEDTPNECVLAVELETDTSCIYRDLKSTSIINDYIGKEGYCESKKCNFEGEDHNKVDKDSYEIDTAGDEGGSATGDELVYDTNEEDYEVFSLRIIHRKNRTGFEENKDFPIVMNTVIAGRYYITEYLGSAAFSKVVQAHDLLMGVDICLKIIKNDKDFFDQSLDEIKLLKFVNKHDPGDEHHILRLYDYFYHQEHLFIVCELLRANLYEFQKFNRESGGEPYFTMSRLQVITRQCLEALVYLHNLGIIHCDLKPENILVKSYRKCEIKVIDLGSSCFQSDNLSLYVQSRSYRAPEVILGHSYDQKIDLWSLGCIVAELYTGEVLFPNEPIVMLLGRMIGILGPIDMEMLATGQDTDKYFTKEYDLYHINEVSILYELRLNLNTRELLFRVNDCFEDP